MGLPTAVQSLIFTGISMLIARIIAGWGDAAVAVQKVGSQIESISWMTAEGFGSAVNAFTAQNYGAGRKDTEATAAGTFQGLGKTMPPSLTGIVFNALRIPMALALGATVLGLNGIWWSISISSILKGIILPVWLGVIFYRWKRK